MKLNTSVVLCSFLMAASAFAGQNLPRCIGSQSTGCDSSLPDPSEVYVKCTEYKAEMLCGEQGIQVSYDSCKAQDGEMYCLVPATAQFTATEVAPAVDAGRSVDGRATAEMSYTPDAISACVAGTSVEAQQALADAFSQARSECGRSPSTNGSESLMVLPTGAETAECVAQVTVSCATNY